MRSVFALIACLSLCAACDKFACNKTTATPVASTAPAAGEKNPLRAQQKPPLLPAIPNAALSKEDTASCDIAADFEKRLSCLMSLAQRNRDPRYCHLVAKLSKQAKADSPEVVRKGALANGCLRTVAFMRDDPTLCAQIELASAAGSCLSFFAMKRSDPNVCDNANGEAQQMCFQNEAARTRDSTLCEKTGPFKDDCRRRLGPSESNP
jgi:hypothetical protein